MKEIAFGLKVNRIFLKCIRAEKYQLAARIAEKHLTKRDLVFLIAIEMNIPKTNPTDLVFVNLEI